MSTEFNLVDRYWNSNFAGNAGMHS